MSFFYYLWERAGDLSHLARSKWPGGVRSEKRSRGRVRKKNVSKKRIKMGGKSMHRGWMNGLESECTRRRDSQRVTSFTLASSTSFWHFALFLEYSQHCYFVPCFPPCLLLCWAGESEREAVWWCRRDAEKGKGKNSEGVPPELERGARNSFLFAYYPLFSLALRHQRYLHWEIGRQLRHRRSWWNLPKPHPPTPFAFYHR